MTRKQELLAKKIEHLSLETFDPTQLVESMGRMAFQARNTARAAKIYEMMLDEETGGVWLCLAGSLISSGLKRVIIELIERNLVDAIVSTGANIVDQDFFEGLGFSHYVGDPFANDEELRELAIDRIYDTYIDEDELRICDETIREIADTLPARPHSSREFIAAMGKYLEDHGKNKESIVLTATRRDVPIFCPAFSDSSAGFGLVKHQWLREKAGEPMLSLDAAKDFLELTKLKLVSKETGLLMVGGGVPKNFAQDTVVAAEILGEEAPMHKYAVQITLAHEHDGALSGSTLKEACSWGKVSMTHEQMVFGEATVTVPLIAGYAYHRFADKPRKARRLASHLDKAGAAV
ncbi:MAG: deoxyhypusine synthase [Planctomycetes bacterium]|nr:deoxyhypusine synthase [Planctomycetota bacterium]